MKQHTITSYAVQVKYDFHTTNGMNTPYTETLAMCTSFNDAQEVLHLYKNAFVVKVKHSKEDSQTLFT